MGVLLREGHDINGLDPEERTPLMYWCVLHINSSECPLYVGLSVQFVSFSFLLSILPEGEGVHITCANVLIKMGANLDHQVSGH